MASLRKRPDTEGEATVAPTVSVAVDHSSSPEAASEALLAQLGDLRASEDLQKQQIVAAQAAEQRRAQWLASSPAANAHYAALGPMHHAAINAGLIDTSPEYFNFMEQQLAALQSQQPEPARLVEDMQRHAPPAPEPEPPRRVQVSAPVSREVPTYTGRRERSNSITLSPAEVQHARVAGVSRRRICEATAKTRSDETFRRVRRRPTMSKPVTTDPNALAAIITGLGGIVIPGPTFRFDLPLSEVRTVIPKINELGPSV